MVSSFVFLDTTGFGLLGDALAFSSYPKTQTNSRPARRGVSDERCSGLVGNGS